MLNISEIDSDRRLREDSLRFIEEVAAVHAAMGMPQSVGRVMGYLLLAEAPVSLDQIALDLEMSKGSAWNATRWLERYGNLRRFGERGSKRALFGPNEDFGKSLITTLTTWQRYGDVLADGAARAGGGVVADRLTDLAGFLYTLKKTVDEMIERWDARISIKDEARARSG